MLMENQMKSALLMLLLMSLAFTGCIVDPGRGDGGHGGWWGDRGHSEHHAEQRTSGNWGRY